VIVVQNENVCAPHLAGLDASARIFKSYRAARPLFKPRTARAMMFDADELIRLLQHEFQHGEWTTSI